MNNKQRRVFLVIASIISTGFTYHLYNQGSRDGIYLGSIMLSVSLITAAIKLVLKGK